MSGKNTIQVAIKVRPLFGKEKDQPCSWRVVDNSIQLVDSQAEPYYFDHIFDQDVTNPIIFDKMAKQIVHSAIQGINGTIFAYGQTSSGKTYTMMGDDDNPGVMVLAAKEIFKEIERTQDRQFLLRVGYIEIYNEKICDLLKKKNQDLKIHETSTGVVSVNCEEIIIRSEDDLLHRLDKGSKERTVGETNMNERSSRSHAIFRIIIESRKMDRSEDDAVIQSVLNLVDLAGSERADQTGARGARLKEGGHINKSLLFLSTVIKRLSENEDDKYISFRDSKLTRILQASLGGNALTSIICTIKPNAVEETLSTINFALRAKSVKNKPQVNEIVSDATMMKRLEHEIKVLKTRLEEEQRKNESQIKVRQLEQRIKDEDLKIISCNSLHSIRSIENRRRTWCPSSTNLDSSTASQPSTLPMPGCHIASGIPSRLQAPKTYNTPLITMRSPVEQPCSSNICGSLPVSQGDLPEIDEEFTPAEQIDFEMITPIRTPPKQELQHDISITPKLIGSTLSTLEIVEHDLWELQSFTNLENKINHESETILKRKIENLTQRNAFLENERHNYLHLKNEIATENLTETQKRTDELKARLNELTNSNNVANEKIAKYEAELAALKSTNEKLAMENREAVNLEFEFKRHKNKSKLRENELLDALNDKEKEISKLEKSLNSLSTELLQNSKEELLQKSLNVCSQTDGSDKICIKCKDLQRLLEENKKNTLEFEKLTLEYEELKLNYAEIEKENEKNKQKLIDLEELQEKEKAECGKLLSEVQQLREKLQTVQKDYADLTTKNSSKQEECMELNRQVEVAKEEMVALEEKFAKLELSWQQQKQSIIDIDAQYINIQRQYEELQCQYEQLDSTRGQSITDYQRLEKENVNLQTEIENLKKKVYDAQQKLLESNAKYEKTANETKEYSTTTSKVQQENELLKNQLLDIQTQFKALQKEYDDLSNQLMDNIQDCEDLKNENIKLKETLKDCEEKKEEILKAESEIHELKSQLEKVLANEKNSSLCRNLSMRSSGVCVEEEGDIADFPQSQDLLNKFCELSESLLEIELEHLKGKTKVFKAVSKNSTSKSYKMYLKNILGIHQSQKEFNKDSENVHLQGSFKENSFQIVELSGQDKAYGMECNEIDTIDCENAAEYIEKLKREIIELKASNEQECLNSRSLLESTERVVSEMRDHITQLSAELLEKSLFVENCACSTYKQQIENLEKDKADMTILCEELQQKVNCTLSGSFDDMMDITVQGADNAQCAVDDTHTQLEQLKLKELELLKSYDSQTKTLELMTQRCADIEADLKAAREQLKNQDNKFKEEHNQLQLDNLQRLELSATEYRENIKKYNKEWEERRNKYEETIKELKNEIDFLKQANVTTEYLKKEIKENVCESQPTDSEDQKLDGVLTIPVVGEHQEIVLPEDIETIKQDKCRLEEDNRDLKEQLNTAKEALEHMTEENRTQCEELTLLDAKLVSLEELLEDAKALHATLIRENSSLKTEIDDIKEDLNCIPELHDKNQQLSDEMEKLSCEYSQLQQKLQKAESQIRGFCKEAASREEAIRNLQTRITQLTVMEEEKKNLAKDFENLKLECAQLQDKLQKTESQIQEFCNEDASREALIQTLQSELCKIPAVEEENKKLDIENVHLRETLKDVQKKEKETSKEIENLRQEINTLKENLSELVSSEAKLQSEKAYLEEKLRQILSEYNLLQTDKVLLDTQLSELNEDKKSLHEKCSALQEEKTVLAEELKYLKDKGNTEKLLQQITKEKDELVQKLRLTSEKLEAAQNQLEEKEKHISHAREEKVQIQKDLLSLKDSLMKTMEEKSKLVEETEIEPEREKEKDGVKMSEDLLEFKQILTKKEQEEDTENCKQDNSQLKKELTKLEQEKQNHRLVLEKLKQDQSNIQQVLEAFKESLSNVIEDKQQELYQLENNYKKAQQQNQDLQQEVKDLTVDVVKFKRDGQEKFMENIQLRSELQEIKASMTKLQDELLNVEQIRLDYQKLKEDKSKLEVAIDMLKKTHAETLESLHEEREQLHKTVQQYEEQKNTIKNKEETLKEKNESLYEQLHEMRGKVHAYEKLLLKDEQMESSLKAAAAANQKLQLEVLQHTSQQENYVSKIETLSSEIENLSLELNKATDEKEILKTKLSHFEETKDDQDTLQNLKSSLEELKLKHDSLLVTNTHLETLSQQLERNLNSAYEKLKEYNRVQEELRILKVQYSEVQNNLKKTVDEAGRCSMLLHEDVERHKQLLQKQLDNYNSLKFEMETKQHSLSEETLKLSNNIEELQKKNLLLEERLREITVRNFEQDLQRQVTDVMPNTSIDLNSSHSPRGRRSLEKSSTTAERRNRRISTHDERRRQSYWGAVHDKETMTDPIDNSCNCMELDRKLKECERNLFIKNSQVTALNMELKNHPLKDENATLKKRLVEELDKHRVEIKRYKNKLYEQNAKAEKAIQEAAHVRATALAAEQQEIAVLPKVVANVETQTDNEISATIQKLQGKYNDLKKICRSRYNVIKELEEKVSQKENADINSLPVADTTALKMVNNKCELCELLKKELNDTREKYEYAKKVLTSRREENLKLRAKIEQPQ